VIGLFRNIYLRRDVLDFLLNIEKEFFVFHITGLGLLLIWSLGLLAPYTIIGFTEILLITALLNFLLKKINRLNLLKIRIYKRLGFNQY